MNRLEAKDEILATVTTGWNIVLPTIVGTNHELRYWGKKYQNPVPVTKYWGRVSVQTVSEDQDTLRNDTRRYRSNGIIIVQLFAPIEDNEVGVRLDQIAEGVRNIFRGCTVADNVQFARARIADNIDPEPAWLRSNVVAEFEYNQFLA